MKIEILYIPGCPNHHPAVERVRGALAAEGIAAEILQVEIADEGTAHRLGFAGSPSVRIDGVDVEGGAPGGAGLSCRTYVSGSVREGVPSLDVLRRAVRSAAGEPE